MTVKELIEQLSKLDQDMEVRVPCDSFGEGITSVVCGMYRRIKTLDDSDETDEIGKDFILIS